MLQLSAQQELSGQEQVTTNQCSIIQCGLVDSSQVHGFLALLHLNGLTPTEGHVELAGDIHVWDIGGYWALPLSWIQNALAINEFSADRWKKPDPDHPSQQLGTSILQNYDFRHSRLWVWLSFAFAIAWIVLLNVILVFASAQLPGFPHPSLP